MATDGITANLNHFHLQNANGICKLFYIPTNSGHFRLDRYNGAPAIIYEVGGVQLTTASINRELADNALLLGPLGEARKAFPMLRSFLDLEANTDLLSHLSDLFTVDTEGLTQRLLVLFPTTKYLRKRLSPN